MNESELAVGQFFLERGWESDFETTSRSSGPDFVLRKDGHVYVAELKQPSESRSDRVIALLSQAILQAQTYAKATPSAKPLALISLKILTDSLIENVTRFRARYAADVAMGLIGADGRSYFEGEGLHDLTNLQRDARPREWPSVQMPTFNLFSDLNQWMLKVLLAQEVPTDLLSAPRKDFSNGVDLADAAGVSTMSVSRFLNTLRKEGFLAEGRVLRLVRREELFRLWKASVLRSTPERAFRYLLPGREKEQLRKFLERHENNSCLGLFDAAESLGLGHVSGATTHVYVRSLGSQSGLSLWKGIVPLRDGDKPSLILRQPIAPESVFRGAVRRDGIPVTDVIQTWLDVLSHPSRGREQARVIEESVLGKIIGGSI